VGRRGGGLRGPDMGLGWRGREERVGGVVWGWVSGAHLGVRRLLRGVAGGFGGGMGGRGGVRYSPGGGGWAVGVVGGVGRVRAGGVRWLREVLGGRWGGGGWGWVWGGGGWGLGGVGGGLGVGGGGGGWGGELWGGRIVWCGRPARARISGMGVKRQWHCEQRATGITLLGYCTRSRIGRAGFGG